MPRVHVCPLSLVSATVAASGASHLITLINDQTPVERPASIPLANHLFLGVNDITEPMEGMVLPAEEHVRELLDFVVTWDRKHPIVVHCYAGISRSTAAAYITLCSVAPDRDERDIARRLRVAAPTAYPNPLIIALGDRMLGRKGRMVEAIASIGRGEIAIEGVPFSLAIAS